MATGRKTGGRDFKPGNCANPKGRHPLLPEQKATRKLNLAEFTVGVEKYRHMTLAELKAAKVDPATSVWDLCIIGWLSQGWNDHRAVAALMERFLGKVPDKVHHSGILAQQTDPFRGEVRTYTLEDKEES